MTQDEIASKADYYTTARLHSNGRWVRIIGRCRYVDGCEVIGLWFWVRDEFGNMAVNWEELTDFSL